MYKNKGDKEANSKDYQRIKNMIRKSLKRHGKLKDSYWEEIDKYVFSTKQKENIVRSIRDMDPNNDNYQNIANILLLKWDC